MPDQPSTAGLPPWVHWIAQDADGASWGYEVEPLRCHHGWYENEVGRRCRMQGAEPGDDWADSLRRTR